MRSRAFVIMLVLAVGFMLMRVLTSMAAQDPQTPSELMRAVTLTQGLAAYPEAREYIQKINTLS